MLNSAPPGSTRPRYQQIADDLTDRIQNGDYRPGAALPSLAQLGEEYAVSKITVQQAVRLLVEQGLVRTVPRQGLFASTPSNREPQRVARRVGVLFPNIPAWSPLYPALFGDLHQWGYEILMRPLPVGTDYASDPERALLEMDALRATCGGGLILFGDRWLVETFLRERRPDEAGVCLENSNGIPSSLPMVSTDNFGGTLAVTRYLLSLGHTRIAYLDDPQLAHSDERMLPGTTHERRYTGCRSALLAAGLAPCELPGLTDALWADPADPERLACFFRQPDRPTAAVCFNDALAARACDRLAEVGIRIPEDLSIAGYDNNRHYWDGEWLTSLDQNCPEIARQLVRLLHEEQERLSRRPAEAAPRILVPPVLHVRRSTAPPP